MYIHDFPATYDFLLCKNPYAKISANTSARVPDIQYISDRPMYRTSDISKSIGTDTQPSRKSIIGSYDTIDVISRLALPSQAAEKKIAGQKTKNSVISTSN